MGRALLWLLAAALAAGAQTPEVTQTAAATTLTVGDLSLTASLADAALELRRGERRARWTVSIANGPDWQRPMAASPPRVTRTRDGCAVVLDYPLDSERRFGLELSARRGQPAIRVSSRLRRLSGGVAGAYYYWSCDWASDRWVAPDRERWSATAYHRDQWESLPQRDWLWLPGAAGGLGLVPTNVWGHGPSAAERVGFFLHALPRSAMLGAGDELRASWAMTFTDDPSTMPALARLLAAELSPEPVGTARGPGQPVPRWLRDLEQANFFYHPAADWTDAAVAERLRRYKLIIGSTPDRAALDRCHAAGVRVLHYVAYTVLLDTARQLAGGGRVYSEWSELPEHDLLDLRNQPDWVCLDDQGQPRQDEWGKAHGHPGQLNTCLHQPGLRDAVLHQVRSIMAMGFDGLFIDLAGPAPECHGARLGRHQHADPAATNDQAYAALLSLIYAEVKRGRPEAVVVHNTVTGIIGSRWSACDAQVLEAVPFGGDNAEPAPFAELAGLTARAAGAWGDDKRVIALTYLSKPAPERLLDDALYAFAWSALSRFVWADAFTLSERADGRDLANELAAIELGSPRSGIQTVDHVRCRRFERGLVALNPDPWPVTVRLPFAFRGALHDAGHGPLDRTGDTITLELAPRSGRVLYLLTSRRTR